MPHNTIIVTDENIHKIISSEIRKYGRYVDLNHINVSQVTNMCGLFFRSEFNGNISNWDTSNVKDMKTLFYGSEFNGDISNWDVSNVTNMRSIFGYSIFNRDISRWDVSSVENMSNMFVASEFNGDISDWKLSPNLFITQDLHNVFEKSHNIKIQNEAIKLKLSLCNHHQKTAQSL